MDWIYTGEGKIKIKIQAVQKLVRIEEENIALSSEVQNHLRPSAFNYYCLYLT